MRKFTAAVLEELGCNEPDNFLTKAINEFPVAIWDQDSVVERIFTACDIWLYEDLLSDELLVEHPFDNGVRGVLDLVTVRDGRARIIDWKSTGDVKRPNYQDELREEFQSSFYLTYGSDALVAQGLPRPYVLDYRCLDEKGNVALVTKLPSETTRKDAELQLARVWNLYNSQIVYETGWARNRPRACFKGGQRGPVCPFWDDCVNMTMPPSPEGDLLEFIPKSKSAIKDFLHCPEQYRRMRVLGERDQVRPSREILIGNAFHNGIAVLWQAAWEKRGNLLALAGI